MLRHTAETLLHALADGDARHHDDELAPAVAAVQFVHRLDVGVGLARTRLHLYGQRKAVALQSVNGPQALGHLYGADVVHDAVCGKRHGIVGKAIDVEHLIVLALVQLEIARAVALGLPQKSVSHAQCRLTLEGLVLVLYLHRIKSL